jgi:hypothetical protein
MFLYILKCENSYFKLTVDKLSLNYESLYYGSNIEEFIGSLSHKFYEQSGYRGGSNYYRYKRV